MIPPPDANDPTLGEAAAALARAEAEEAGTTEPAVTPDPASGETVVPADEATDTGVKTASPEPAAGTPATEDKPKTNSTEQPKGPDGKFVSRYEKAKGRLGKEFEEAKTQKAEALKLQAELKAERDAIAKERAEFKAAQAKAQAPKHDPARYDAAATEWEAEAQRLESIGKKVYDDLEGKGEYDQAEKRLERAKADATEQRALAKRARAYAAELRANPPKQEEPDKEAEDRLEASRKEWLTKAGQEFPEVVKAGSPEKAAFDEFLQQNRAVVFGPDGKVKDPQAVYYASRLVTAEVRAQKVPTMEKELADLRAKVKEQNEQLNVSATDIGGGNLQGRKFEDLSDAEQEAQLRTEAAARDRR